MDVLSCPVGQYETVSTGTDSQIIRGPDRVEYIVRGTSLPAKFKIDLQTSHPKISLGKQKQVMKID